MSPSSIARRAVLLNMLLIMAIILAGLLPLATPARALSPMPQCRFDPDGYLYVKGGSPQGFEELDHIKLQVNDENSRRPTPESHLAAKNGKSYRFASLGEFQTHPSGRGITFEFTTEIVAGVNYQFSGKFSSICVLAKTELDPENAVAVGRIVKFEKGKKKRTADAEFTYSNAPRQQISRQSNDEPEAGTGREVLAIVTKIEPKAYTDDLGDGKVLVSDIIRFAVVEPTEFKHITVTAYYQGAPTVQGKRLQIGDHVRFVLPSEVQRHGILLQDLKGLRFRE